MYAPRGIVVFAVLSLAVLGAVRAVAGELAADPLDTPTMEEVLAAPRLVPSPTHPQAAPSSDGVLRLAWVDPVDAAGRCAPRAREEATRVLKAMGVRVQWRPAKPGEPDRAGEIRVIVLDRVARRPGGAVVLGATPSRFDARPFVWIHVPSVREAVRLSGSSVNGLELRDQYLLATALGRVIVHEVVHALTPGTPHGLGLMAPRLSASDLTVAALPVAPEVGVAVRAALSGEAPRPPAAADTGLLAAEHARGERRP